MKRLVLLLFLAGISFRAISQRLYIPQNETPSSLHQMGKKWGNYADSSTTYQWNNGSWSALMTKVYTYNSGDLVETIMEYNAQSGILEHKYTYSYDNQDRLIEIYMEANTGSSLVPFKKYSYTFDAEGNRVANRTESYNGGSWSVTSGDSIAYTYDAQKRITEMSMFQYSNGSIYPIQKLLFGDFALDNLPGTLTVQSYQGTYTNYIQLKYISWRAGFDQMNINPSSYYGYLWQSGTWVNATYDSALVSNGRMEVNYLFQINGNNLDSMSKTTYRYDKLDKLWETISYAYSAGNWVASEGTRDSNSYGSYDELRTQTSSYYSNQSWNFLGKEEFYYNSLSVNAVSKNRLACYPNPAKNIVYFQVDDEPVHVELVDQQGKTHPVQWEMDKLLLEGIPAGIYLLRMQGLKGSYQSRIQLLP